MSDGDDDAREDAMQSHDMGDALSDEAIAAAMAGFERELADMSARDDSVGEGESATSFDDELQGLLGNKAKMALIVTSISSADLLAAFCQLSDISAQCLYTEHGATAVLRALDGDAPEAAARDITEVVSGLEVVLSVNRADKLDTHVYRDGRPCELVPPPVLFAATAPFVEDLLLGISTVSEVAQSGADMVDVSSLSREQAMRVIADHMRIGRDPSGI